MKIRINKRASQGCQCRIFRKWAILKANDQPLLHSFSSTEKGAWEKVQAKAAKRIDGLPGWFGQYTKKELKAKGLRSAKCEIHVLNAEASDAKRSEG